MSQVSAVRSEPLTMGVVISGLIRSLRVKQWAKNGVVFAALVFAGELFDVDSLVRSTAAFGIFCIMSSGVYLLNDVFDVTNDRKHPTKCKRPVAAGEVPPARSPRSGVSSVGVP